MILLDTNVVSELMRHAPDAAVEAWVASEDAAGLFISAITEAELLYDVAILPKGRRQADLARAVSEMLAEDFSGRIVPFDSAAAVASAEVRAERRQAGRPIAQFDAQIAAIARSRGAALATRNVTDFEGCGIEVINPWTST